MTSRAWPRPQAWLAIFALAAHISRKWPYGQKAGTSFLAAAENDFLTRPKKLNEQKKETLMALPSGAEIALASFSGPGPGQFAGDAPDLAAKAARLGEKAGRKKPAAPRARKTQNKENEMASASENPSAPPCPGEIEAKATRKTLSRLSEMSHLPDSAIEYALPPSHINFIGNEDDLTSAVPLNPGDGQDSQNSRSG
jgi:hypothetical protein